MAFRAQMHQCSSCTCLFKFLAEKCLSLAVMSYNSHSSRHLRIVQDKSLDTENGQRACFPRCKCRYVVVGNLRGIKSSPPMTLSSAQFADTPNGCLRCSSTCRESVRRRVHGKNCSPESSAGSAEHLCVADKSLYPAVQRQQPSASTRQDSCSCDDKFVAVQDVL